MKSKVIELRTDFIDYGQTIFTANVMGITVSELIEHFFIFMIQHTSLSINEALRHGRRQAQGQPQAAALHLSKAIKTSL